MIRMLAKQFHIDKETICKIITEDSGEKKLYARFVPNALMSEQFPLNVQKQSQIF